MARQRWIGLDIGGANLKAADTAGTTASHPFPLWREPARLAAAIADLVEGFPPFDAVALTMTGELADCYYDRNEGVRRIITATRQALPASMLRVYSTDGRFLPPSNACNAVQSIAASNWHATASFLAAQFPAGRSLMIDIGSTTCDLIPLCEGRVASEGSCDHTRLAAGELVYVGATRTPVCSLVSTLPVKGKPVAIMRECFATIGDCATILELGAGEQKAEETADGLSGVSSACLNRLARMIGLDHRHIDAACAAEAATVVVGTAQSLIADAIEKLGVFDRWLVCGHGDWLLPKPPCKVLTPIGSGHPALARVGPAYAVACLADDRLGV